MTSAQNPGVLPLGPDTLRSNPASVRVLVEMDYGNLSRADRLANMMDRSEMCRALRCIDIVWGDTLRTVRGTGTATVHLASFLDGVVYYVREPVVYDCSMLDVTAAHPIEHPCSAWPLYWNNP